MRNESEEYRGWIVEYLLGTPNSVISMICLSQLVDCLVIGDATSLLDIGPRLGINFACAFSTLVPMDIHLLRSNRFTAPRYASWIEYNAQSTPAIPLLS